MVTLQPEVRRDVRPAVHRGVPPVRQACCPEPALQSAQVLVSVSAWWSSAQRAQPAARRGPQASGWALAWGLAQRGAPLEEPPQAVPAVWEPDVRRAEPEAAVSARAAAEPRPEAASVRAVAGLRPEAATAASERPVAGVVVAAPDASEPVEAEVSDATERLPAAAVREDAEVQPRAAVRSDVQELQAALRPGAVAVPDAQRAAVPWALPSEAASVFRQGRSLVAAPAQRRATARSAHAMRCLPVASRSEPWSQAARNEGWSWWSTSPEGSLTKWWDDEVLG